MRTKEEIIQKIKEEKALLSPLEYKKKLLLSDLKAICKKIKLERAIILKLADDLTQFKEE